jgi:hypothetical protein
MKQKLFFKKISKTDKPLVFLTTRRREKTEINKIRGKKKRTSQQIPIKSRRSSGNILKTCTQRNWKFQKKTIDF